ncbi:4-(cytidine 5'-diphospho)-2-C-methyl-D-erythritol kinase [Sphingomonas solaris]|uniref:4-diphosphocytidyl-2-C-methyl-D-erythritol kinase n=1 Tax=Alterirhizorhabdus solaris TaxID=2529389 RepID=A0A558QS34_9SPHN|nr:4-(cytidine 5'-diphospho)-2-C-methyl-D-erythritol kinase [Sphingomonas solaris]TVV69924.1 4-(cytidine 5'-diphospho)-2-C-methyl-D-erythritol kinase [Sphingomonas solaris]
MRDRETAFAKINLALHVRRRRADGYHDLETLFAFAEEGDVLHATPADALSLTVGGPFAAALAGDDPADNLVLRAGEALRMAFGVTAGAALTLDKRLPVASGIGGGSADAAAALRLLVRVWRLPAGDPRITAISATLGADVPACLGSVATRGDGRGDRLVGVDAAALTGMPLLLVNPGVALSTAAVFAGWDGQDRGALAVGAPWAAARSGRNDLEPPARVLVPGIVAVLDELGAGEGVRLVRMSGSGATCFALYEDARGRDAAAARIAVARPEWWRLATRLR